MKEIFGMLLLVLGAELMGRGFGMCSPKTQDEFAKKFYERIKVYMKVNNA